MNHPTLCLLVINSEEGGGWEEGGVYGSYFLSNLMDMGHLPVCCILLHLLIIIFYYTCTNLTVVLISEERLLCSFVST